MLIVNEIFQSVDGEVNRWGQGHLTTFIRLAGCNLNCSYCDTTYSKNVNSGKQYTDTELFKKLNLTAGQKVTITGGEPLMQEAGLLKLCKILRRNKINISIETNGSLPIPFDDFQNNGCGQINWVIDWKIPEPNEPPIFDWANFRDARDTDWIKFVIGNDYDYQYAKDRYIKHQMADVHVAFSPMVGSKMSPQMLIDKMFQDGLYDVVLNIQMHKFIKVK